ncbi:MAG: ABC-F family ATP-binding cassette domain-containing protein [Clostridia bacterium]
MGVIDFRDVRKSFGDRLVLDGVSFEIHQNQKVALIGRNGSGKTTVFNIIAGVCDYEGQVGIRKDLTVSFLKQTHEDVQNIISVDILKSAFESLADVHKQMLVLEKTMREHPEDRLVVGEYGRLHEKYEFMGGYNTGEKLNRIITGLGIPQEVCENQFQNLSGGEKTMVMLGKALLMNPDILLLDEPTNHLDMKACEWLEKYIFEYKGTVLYISHDRTFINNTAQKVVELKFHKAQAYNGNYDAYLLQREQEKERDLKLYERQQREIARLTETARRMRSYGTEISIKRALNLEKRMERMDPAQRPVDEKSLSFSFSESRNSSKEVFRAENLSKRYGDKVVLRDVTFLVRSGDRVGVIGPNGAGKSTLVRLIMGMEDPDGGMIRMGKGMKVAYLEQDVAFEHPEKTVLEEVCDTLKLMVPSARNLLGKYLFRGDDVFKKISILSGGEKSRLRLLLQMQSDVNLLVLDEPTNHLDIPSREELEEAISLFRGTMVFISHDRHSINKFAKRIFEVTDGGLVATEGNYTLYAKAREKEPIKVSKTVAAVKDKGAEKRRILVELREAEKNISQLEEKLAETDREMEENPSDYALLTKRGRERDELSDKLEEAYQRWMDLKERAE